MAEYIDKQKYREEWLKFKTFEPMKCLDLIPVADVIERSKIDNALADMQLMLDQEVLNANVISDVGQGIAIAMGLLKRNIGE